MEKLVETLGITRLSKSQVSVMAKELDAHVEDFRTRPLDAGPYTFLAADSTSEGFAQLEAALPFRGYSRSHLTRQRDTRR